MSQMWKWPVEIEPYREVLDTILPKRCASNWYPYEVEDYDDDLRKFGVNGWLSFETESSRTVNYVQKKLENHNVDYIVTWEEGRCKGSSFVQEFTFYVKDTWCAHLLTGEFRGLGIGTKMGII